MKNSLIALTFLFSGFVMGDYYASSHLTKACYSFVGGHEDSEVCFPMWDNCANESSKMHEYSKNFSWYVTTCHWK